MCPMIDILLDHPRMTQHTGTRLSALELLTQLQWRGLLKLRLHDLRLLKILVW
jgi:hypothetical protein